MAVWHNKYNSYNQYSKWCLATLQKGLDLEGIFQVDTTRRLNQE
jgi:hypothetical protein